MPTELPKHTSALSSMAIRLCLTSQGFSKDHEYFCFIIAFLFSGFWNLAAALPQLQVRLFERTEMVGSSFPSTHSWAHVPTVLCQGWKNRMEAPWQSDTLQGEHFCLWRYFKPHHSSGVSDIMESLVARLNSQCAFWTPSISWVPVVFLFVAQRTPWGKSL